MTKRYVNAYAIWTLGASNPVGVTNALLDAMKEARDEGGDPSNDTAVQMILDHLCFLCHIAQPSMAMFPSSWNRIFDKVEEKAK